MKKEMLMKNYNFRKRNLFSGPHLPGLLFIVADVFAWISPAMLKSTSSPEKIAWAGTGGVLIGSMIISSYTGTLIDLGRNRVKEYFSCFGFKFGKWTNLPDIRAIKVLSVSYRTTNTPNGISPTLSGNVIQFKTFLYSESTQPVLSFEYSHRDRAVRDAEQLAAGLNADLELRLSEPA